MTRKAKGIALLLLGCVFLLIAGGWYLYNVYEDRSAGQKSAEILSKWDQSNITVDESDDNRPIITVDGDAFCGKIVIDKLQIELPIYDEWDYARLKSAPCRYTGSIITNDIIVVAHNYNSHFGTLDQLIIGDRILIFDAYGTTHHYVVKDLILLDGTAVTDMHAGGWDLTLFTCTVGGEQRVTVRCEKVL